MLIQYSINIQVTNRNNNNKNNKSNLKNQLISNNNHNNFHQLRLIKNKIVKIKIKIPIIKTNIKHKLINKQTNLIYILLWQQSHLLLFISKYLHFMVEEIIGFCQQAIILFYQIINMIHLHLK